MLKMPAPPLFRYIPICKNVINFLILIINDIDLCANLLYNIINDIISDCVAAYFDSIGHFADGGIRGK